VHMERLRSGADVRSTKHGILIETRDCLCNKHTHIEGSAKPHFQKVKGSPIHYKYYIIMYLCPDLKKHFEVFCTDLWDRTDDMSAGLCLDQMVKHNVDQMPINYMLVRIP